MNERDDGSQSRARISDDELLACWRAGDDTARAAFIVRWCGAVRRFFVNTLRTGADDLVVRSFMQLDVAVEERPASSSAPVLVFGIAYRLLEEARQSEQHSGESAHVVDVDDQDALPIGEASAEERRAVEAILGLPLEQRIAVLLRHWEKVSEDEVAEILDVPATVVRSRLALAAAAVRERLGLPPLPSRPIG